MAKQYKLTNTFTKLTEDTGTIYNAGIDVVELVSDTNQTVNQGVRLISGQKQAFSGTVYARSVGDTATINVVDFREGDSGKGGALLPDGSTAAAASELNSKLWAESAESPDGSADTDSTTGKTQSSKSWALSAKMSETNAASAAGKCQGIVDDAAATLAAAISKISQLIVDCGDTSEIPVQIDIGDAVYPTTICALSATQPATGTQLWIEKE